MSVVYCQECDQHIDTDYDNVVEHPWKKGDLVCEACKDTLVYEAKMCAEEDYYDD